MNTVRRNSSDDTGEQDVRGLRRFTEELRELHEHNPTVRTDEGALNGGQLTGPSGFMENEDEDGVEAELSSMVDSGELCFGWDDERGEFVYWVPEVETVPTAPVTPARERSHRAPKPPRKVLRRAAMAVTAAALPFFVGMVSEAALAQHARPTPPPTGGYTEADTISNETPVHPKAPEPHRSSVSKAAVTPEPTVQPRRTAPAATTAPARTSSTPSAAPSTARPAATGHRKTSRRSQTPERRTWSRTEGAETSQSRDRHNPYEGRHRKHTGPVRTVIGDILTPIGTLLR